MLNRVSRAIANELSFHVHEIVEAADQGDPESGKWLLTAFPAHDRLLEAHWASEPVVGLATPQKQYSGACVRR
jgi:hypothetical protein